MLILNDLIKYSFTAENIDKIVQGTAQPTYVLTKMSPYFSKELHMVSTENKVLNPAQQQQQQQQQPKTFYQPQQKDTLFWCLYIILNGLDEYEHAISKPGEIFKKEKETRFQLSQKFAAFYNANKSFIKSHKWKRSCLEANLIYNTMEFPTFACCCSMLNYKLIIFNDCIKSIVVPPSMDEEKTIVIRERMMKGDYVYELHRCCEGGAVEDVGAGNNDALADLPLSKLYEVPRFDIPLLSISSYRKADLEEICGKLGLSVTDKFGHALLKKELYVRVQNKMKRS